MNKETWIRIGFAAIAFFAAAVLFVCDIPTPLWLRLVVTFCLLVALVCVTYFNQDFTEAAAQGTGITRQIKREQKPDYAGERFYTIDKE